MAAIQQNITGTISVAIAPTGETETPGVTGSHQTTDNWAFTPIVDSIQLTRLCQLYRSEFEEIDTNDVNKIFPPASMLDAQGRPALDYSPVLETNSTGVFVKLDNKYRPIFYAQAKQSVKPKTILDIPGALGLITSIKTNVLEGSVTFTTNSFHGRNLGWFSFEQPTNLSPELRRICRMGPYLGHYIWVTNSQNFLKFSLLALGGTNTFPASVGGGSVGGASSSSPGTLFINQNGLIKLY
jgi:hypothetical protein